MFASEMAVARFRTKHCPMNYCRVVWGERSCRRLLLGQLSAVFYRRPRMAIDFIRRLDQETEQKLRGFYATLSEKDQ